MEPLKCTYLSTLGRENMINMDMILLFLFKPVDNHEITLVHNSVAYHLSALEIVIDIGVD